MSAVVLSTTFTTIGRIRDVLDIKTCRDNCQGPCHLPPGLYCKSLLYGLPSTLINRLQRLQNAAARVVTRAGKQEHITPVLFQLHWLPVWYRITFKILLLTYRVHGLSPASLTTLLVPTNYLGHLDEASSGFYASPRPGCSPMGIGGLLALLQSSGTVCNANFGKSLAWALLIPESPQNPPTLTRL